MFFGKDPGRTFGTYLARTVTVLLLLAAAACAVLFGYNRFTFAVVPLGEREVVLEYGQPYQEPGAQVSLSGSRFWQNGVDTNARIHTEGAVDAGSLGTYTITYSSQYGFWRASAQRTVRIVDTSAPDLKLLGGQNVYVIPGAVYDESGYFAWDACDGNLTDRVERREEDGRIVYSVTDSSGNRTEAIRIVSYEDNIPPEITLSGGDRVEMYIGSQFTEPGYTAWDNSEGDITELVTVEGQIQRYRTGTYTLTYSVADMYDNLATAERTVCVIPYPRPEQVTPEGKVIYLTFDDGPSAYTRELLAVLEKYDVKATFFVVCNKYSDVIGEIAEAGHAVGIHTATHSYKTIYASEEAYVADLTRVQDLIIEQTGSPTTLIRFPGGSSNTVSRFNQGIMSRLAVMVEDMGYQYFDWNVDSRDAGGAETADEVYENVTNGIRGRQIAVVLQHDIKGYSVEAVERIIRWGLANGYTFLPLDSTSPTCHHGINN